MFNDVNYLLMMIDDKHRFDKNANQHKTCEKSFKGLETYLVKITGAEFYEKCKTRHLCFCQNLFRRSRKDKNYV